MRKRFPGGGLGVAIVTAQESSPLSSDFPAMRLRCARHMLHHFAKHATNVS
jgi:hypothetical protein